jgi:hypothetical protein
MGSGIARAAVSGVLVALLSCAAHARAQEGQVADAASDEELSDSDAAPGSEQAGRNVDLKVRRLRIAGWSFVVTSAVVFSSIFWAGEKGHTTSIPASIGLGMSSAGLLTIGGALLLRARLMSGRNEDDDRAAVSVGFTGTGGRLRIRF